MNSSISDFLPSILPTGRADPSDSVKYQTYSDTIKYQVYSDVDDSATPKTEYKLPKAPVNTVRDVSAIVDGEKKSLDRDDDWIVSDKKKIIFVDGGERPDDGTEFTVTYTARSILSRYVESVEEETELVDEEIGVTGPISSEDNTVVSSKYVSTASDEELDEIGKLFGPLGQRAGRDTERYRQYLKAIAKVYNGRGTKDSVANAVSTVISSEDVTIERDEISFKEYFSDNEYSVEFDKFEDHKVSLLYDIAEIADPSGVKFVGPIYNVEGGGPRFNEGPKINVDEYERFSVLSDVPDDFIDPLSPKENIRLELEIFNDDVTSEQRLPRTFEWAHQKTSTVKGADGGDWNQFQWGQDAWDSPNQIDIEITGDLWDFADWNRIVPQIESPVSISTGPTITDLAVLTIADRGPGSTVNVNDSAQPSYYRDLTNSTLVNDNIPAFNITFEPATTAFTDDAVTIPPSEASVDIVALTDIQSSDVENTVTESTGLIDTKSSEVEDTVTESTGLTDIQSSEVEGGVTESTGLIDTKSSKVEDAVTEAVSGIDSPTVNNGTKTSSLSYSNDLVTFEVRKFSWGEKWGTDLLWSSSDV